MKIKEVDLMKRILSLAIVLISAFSFVLAQGGDSMKPEVEAAKLFNEGNALLRSGNYKAAIEKYDQALKFQQDPKFYYNKGLAHKALRQNEEAINAFKQAINLKQDFAPAYNAIAGIYLVQGDYDNAIENYKKALEYDKKLDAAVKGIVEALIGKSNFLIQAGKFQEALDLLVQATSYRQDYPKVYVMLAIVYNKLSQHDKAVESAKKAIELNPKSADAYFELGVAYKKLGQVEEAKKAFLEAKKDPRLARNAQYELDLLKEQ
jgi:tetratricopeptide (TPR) repeat protein